MLKEQLPPSWREALEAEFSKPYMASLEAFLEHERQEHAVYPPPEDMLNALKYTPFDQVRVLVVGQDPYHGKGQAHGLAFSVRRGVRPPPSLLNIFKELQDDLGLPTPKHGSLEHWAKQGVLLLNTSLTVRAGEPASHKNKGWEHFTDAIIKAVSDKPQPVVFVLWGAHAQKKLGLIDTSRHTVIKAAHPSPYSADKGFFGSRPFSKINAALRKQGQPEIDWSLD